MATEDMENTTDSFCVHTLIGNPFFFAAAFPSSHYTPILIPTLLAPLLFLSCNKSVTRVFIPQQETVKARISLFRVDWPRKGPQNIFLNGIGLNLCTKI